MEYSVTNSLSFTFSLTPLEQFSLTRIWPSWFTNLDLYLFNVLIFTLSLSVNSRLLTFTFTFTDLTELSLRRIYPTVNVNVLIIDSVTYSLLDIRSEFYLIKLITIFILILTGNLIGLIPYTFTFTSYFTISLSLSYPIIGTFTLISVIRNGLLYLNIFIPSGTPLPLAPLLIIIESLSYTARSISLGTRLAANILAGHSLLHIITGFHLTLLHNITDLSSPSPSPTPTPNWRRFSLTDTDQLSGIGIGYGLFSLLVVVLVLVLPFLLLLTLFIMELIIAILHAYLFLLLTINYLTNALMIT